MTIMLADNADVEKIKEEIAAAKALPVKSIADDIAGEPESPFDEGIDSSFDNNEEEEE
jgi:hypothetical protein